MTETKTQPKWRQVMGYVIKYGVPLIVTILLCRLLFNGVDFNEMMATIRNECDFRWIGLALAISIFSHVFRAMRWRIQLNALGIRQGLFPLTLSIFGTYAVNLVLPRLGELWRTGYIAKRSDAPFAKVFGSMVADRLADTVTVLLLTVVTFFLATKQLGKYLSDNSDSYLGILKIVQSPWLWLGVIVVIGFCVWFLMQKSTNPLVLKLQGFVKGLWQGFAVIVTMPGKLRWLVLTVCIWGCYFMQLYVAFFAFPFTEAIVTQYGVLAVLVTFVLSSISMGVPSNGGIGPWQWSVIIALGMYGMARPEATTFANLVMGSQTLLLILLGIFTFACISLQNKKQA